MKKPRVSVVMTVRDGMPHLPSTVASVLGQSASDLELLVVDDGSTDGSDAYLHGVADRRLRILKAPRPGRAHALNHALDEARSDLVANVDADDPMHPERLALSLVAIDQAPDLAVISTRVKRIFGDDAPVWEAPRWDGTGSPPLRDVTSMLGWRNPVIHSSVLMRRDVVSSVGGYPETPQNVDYRLWGRLACNGHRIGQLQVVLQAVRTHPRQAFGASPRRTYVRDSLRVQSWIAREALGWGRIRTSVAVATRWTYGLLPFHSRNRIRSWWDS